MSNHYNNNNYDSYDHYNNKHHSESNWLQEQFRKYKMQKMMKEMMHGNFDDSDSVQFKPYSMDHGMKNNQMKKFEIMKMMKNVFGNEYSNDHYDMMEKYFKNDNDMDAFEMMKMMMKFSGDESNIDMSQMMHSMEKMYGNDYKMNEHDMMKMMNEKNFESHDSYAPPQARHRYKRQVYKPQARNTEHRLDKGDRLFAKLREQKREHEHHVGNMTCVLKETKVLNKENKIDVQSLKQYMQQYTLPSPWFKKNFE